MPEVAFEPITDPEDPRLKNTPLNEPAEAGLFEDILSDKASPSNTVTGVKARVYGPIVGEYHRDAMFGPHGNSLGPNDVALSPDWLEIFPLGSKIRSGRKDYVVADVSYTKPGHPNVNTIEFRDQKNPPATVDISPSPTASPLGGGTGLFDDIVGRAGPAGEAAAPTGGMFGDIVDEEQAAVAPVARTQFDLPPSRPPSPTPSGAPSPQTGPEEPNWLQKTGRAVAKYGREMIPQSGEQLAQMAHIPLDFTQPEELARLMSPVMGAQLDLFNQVRNRMTQIQNADQSPPFSQERYDAATATALDLLGIATIGGGAKAMGRAGGALRASEPAVPLPPGTAGAEPPPLPNVPLPKPQEAQMTVPVPIISQAEREAIKYGGESRGLTPEDLAAIEQIEPPTVPGEPPSVPPAAPTVPEPAPAPAPRRPLEKAVMMKVRPLQQLRRQLAAAEKAGEAGFRRGTREARVQAREAAQIEARMVKDTVATVDEWIAQDIEDTRRILISFSRHLPLHERGKFIPAITKAIRKPAIFSKDPGVIQRRAASLLDRMTEAIYQQNKREVQGKIRKLLDKIEASPSVVLEQKRIVQQIRKTFENLKDKMSLDMLERMLVQLKWREATGRDLFTLNAVIENRRKEIALREIEAQGTRTANKPKQALLPLGDVETWWKRITASIAEDIHRIEKFNAAITPMDWVFQLFDQRQFGALWRHLKAPIDIQYGQFLDTAHVYKQRLIDVLNKHKLHEGNLRRIYAHAEYRQEGGEANLKARGYTDKDIATIKNVGQLTKGERAYLKEADAILTEMFPVIKDVLEKFYNQELPHVPNYFPRIRDWDYYNSLSIEEGKFAEAYRRTNTQAGFTKERQGAITKNLDNAHEVMMNHIDDAVYHMTMGPEIKRAARIVGDDRFNALTGDFGQQLFADWVDVLARNGGEGSGRRIGWMDSLRKNTGVAQLAFRLTTTFLQPTQLIQALPYLSKGNLAKTLSDFGNPANRQWILKNFPEVKHRMTDDPAAMGYTRKSIRDKAARAGFHLISSWDRAAAMTVAETAYRDALERRGLTFNRNDAIHMQAMAEAMTIVRKTQASPFTKDVPLALSGGKLAGNKSLNQAIFQFQNFTMNRWAMIKGDALQMGVKDKSPKTAAKVTGYLLVATMAEQMLREGIANALRATLGVTQSEESKITEEQKKSLSQRVVERMASDLAFNMPILSNIAGMYRYDSSGVPIVDTLADVIKGARSFVRGVKPETKAAGAIRAAQGVSGAVGVPSGQIGDILSRLIRGTANQQGPVEGYYPLAPPPPPPPPPPPAP